MVANINIVFVITLAISGCASAGKHDIYAGHTVYGVQLNDRSDLELLHHLEKTLDLDVWQHGLPGSRDAKVMVSPQHRADFLNELDKNGLRHYLELSDVVKAFEEFDEEISRHRAIKKNDNGRLQFSQYPRHDETLSRVIESLWDRVPGY